MFLPLQGHVLPEKLKRSFLFLSRVIELTGDVTPDMKSIAKADLIVTTPEKWDGVSRSWQNRNYVKQVTILIIDEIHLLGGYHCVWSKFTNFNSPTCNTQHQGLLND